MEAENTDGNEEAESETDDEEERDEVEDEDKYDDDDYDNYPEVICSSVNYKYSCPSLSLLTYLFCLQAWWCVAVVEQFSCKM